MTSLGNSEYTSKPLGPMLPKHLNQERRNTMTTRSMFVKTLAIVALIFCAALSIAILNANRVNAFNPQPEPPSFGLLSLNPGQTLRMNVVSVSSATRHVMFGVDMYRRSGSQTQMASCPTTHR